jgi:hypothetical protein
MTKRNGKDDTQDGDSPKEESRKKDIEKWARFSQRG